MSQLRADLRDPRLAGRPACGGGKGGSYSSGDHGGAGARRAHRGFVAQARPGADRCPHRDVRVARQGDRRRVRALGPQPSARVHLGRRNRDHPGPLVGRRGTREIAGRRQGQAGQAAAGRAVRLYLRPGRQLAAPVHRRPAAGRPAGNARDHPVGPLPCWGWGDIPDQSGRRWDGDDGSSPMPKTPNGLADLPPILPGWGPRRARPATSPADGSAIRYCDLIT